jgi:hypothetical protein
MKCPHCGIEIRDTTVICGYCGGKIPQKKGTPVSQKGGKVVAGAAMPQRAPPAKRSGDEEPETDEEEEEGGLSSLLQPNEQVLIGSLNVSVKKFLFHAYLTDQRIFLLDTHEKKLKVTAKDIPLDTITDSVVEYSETSDPVLVLSIRAADEEIKTMKLVFSQDGMDRSGEVDEWVGLLSEQSRPKKHKKPPVQKGPVPEPVVEPEPEEEPVPAAVAKPAQIRQELHPARRPTKDHERQPPVKRLLSMYQASKEEEPQEPAAPRRIESRTAEQAARKTSARPPTYREIPPATKSEIQPVKKVEVQSAMKTAMKTAMQPVKQPSPQAIKRPDSELHKKSLPEPEMLPTAVQRRVLSEKEEISEEEESELPIFCQKCGKKLPAAANFCPGCGAKLGPHKPSSDQPVSHERRFQKSEGTKPEDKPERPPAKTPAKKTPKASDMTLLHKFLRR